jgi:hypothetical protein
MGGTLKRGVYRIAALSAMVALLAGVAAASTSSVTITSPYPGQSISLKRNPAFAVAGKVSFTTPAAASTKFNLRRDGCGTTNDNPHLSTTSGTDAGDGCGLVFSIVGAGSEANKGAFIDYPATDGLPLTIDSSREVTGVLQLDGLGGASAGLVTVDVSLEGLLNGSGVAIGSDTEQVLFTPDQSSYVVPFHFSPSGVVDKADLSGLDLRVYVHGAYANSGFIANSGASYVTVPAWTASWNKVVQVSLDDASFANALNANVGSDGSSWTTAFPTPAVGTHTLYARSTQGFDTSATATRSIKVTR